MSPSRRRSLPKRLPRARSFGLAALALAALTLGVACSSEPISAPPGCVPGQSIACVGAGGCAGGQVCRADGTGYDECQCGAPDAATDASPDDGSTTDTGADDAAPDTSTPSDSATDDSATADAATDAADAADSSSDAAPDADAAPADTGPDPNKDDDGDGYKYIDDCNDGDPTVNPGAFEILGDGVDNDCDGKTDVADDCDTIVDANHYKSTDAMDFARALGLCRTAKADGAGKQKTWGVLGAELVRADGTPLSADGFVQHGVLQKFGSLLPRSGKNLVALSTGTARTPEHPDFKAPRSASFSGTSKVAPPAGFPKNVAGCPTPTSSTANDSVNLKLRVRVPTNARSFAFDFDFFSSEYINFVCSAYNDSFVAILDSTKPLDPKYAKNVASDPLGNPINVNSGYFEVCTPGTKGAMTFPCSKGTSQLVGTGFWDSDPKQNGATSWLSTSAPVAPGEEITLQLMIWDTGDHILDSTVLLDNWRWSTADIPAPTTARPE